mgnify:CR=1 FL=1
MNTQNTLSPEVHEQLHRLTQAENAEQALQELLPDYLKLKIFFCRQEIARLEMRWGMSYETFEQASPNWESGFRFDVEKEYEYWGEQVALLAYYQKLQAEWT